MQYPRLVLITGASRGIGRALSLKLLDAGSRVIGIGRDFSYWSLPRAGFEVITADLADLEALPQLFSEVAKAHRELDAVVSNAGAGRFGHLEQFSPRQIRASVDLNLTQHILVARSCLPLLKRRERADLIFMGSLSAPARRPRTPSPRRTSPMQSSPCSAHPPAPWWTKSTCRPSRRLYASVLPQGSEDHICPHRHLGLFKVPSS